MKLVRIPAGRFVMGDADCDGDAYAAGEVDERPAAVVKIDKSFWIGAYEVTNAQYRRFDLEHRTGYFTKRYPGVDGPGLALDAPEQPVIRVSWQQAMAFCRWLSDRSGMRVTLPTEAQWEYACRAGTATAMSYGVVDADFSRHANLADRALAIRPPETGGLTSAIVNPYLGGKFSGIMLDSVFGGDIPCNQDSADGNAVTAEVGRFTPNAWRLYDLHGNVAEWTLTTYRAYPYQGDDGRNRASVGSEKVVRGGSFRDRPHRCRSAFRLSYPAWQRVHNVGFRILIQDDGGDATDG
jgi:formylglycine-generating enzyme required for sulfatase activity